MQAWLGEHENPRPAGVHLDAAHGAVMGCQGRTCGKGHGCRDAGVGTDGGLGSPHPPPCHFNCKFQTGKGYRIGNVTPGGGVAVGFVFFQKKNARTMKSRSSSPLTHSLLFFLSPKFCMKHLRTGTPSSFLHAINPSQSASQLLLGDPCRFMGPFAPLRVSLRSCHTLLKPCFGARTRCWCTLVEMPVPTQL